MIKPILTLSFCALFLTACGGSDSPSSNNGGTGTGGDGTGGTDTGGSGGGTDPVFAGETGDFADTANAVGGLDASTTVCPASVTESFTGWAQNGGSWCVFKCPTTSDYANADGDDWGYSTVTQFTCRDTNAAAGSAITAQIFSPINGCADANCGISPPFPRVYISGTANLANANAYNCQAWEFDGGTKEWSQSASPAAFTLTLSEGGPGNDNGTATTWSFNAGVLTLETGRVMNNISAGASSFSSWNSNTSLTRCKASS